METLQEYLARFDVLFDEQGYFGHPLIQVALIVVVSLLLAWMIDFVVTRWVRRLTQRTETEFDDKLLAAVHGPLRTSIVLIGSILAVHRLGLSEDWEDDLISVFGTIAIVVWMVFGIRVASLVLGSLSRRRGRLHWIDNRTLPLLSNLARVLLVGFGIYSIFLIWGWDVTAWLASAGVVGIALGFAAKDTLSNLFSGVFILADAPYKVGDFVVLDSGERGRVTHVGIRSTRLLTRDDIEITLPNAVIGNAKIINESGGPSEKERVRVAVSVAYGSDIDHLRDVLMQIALNEDRICRDPEPRVRFRTFGASSLDFELLGWIDEPVLRGRVLDAMNVAAYKALNREGFEIPFPQRDLWLRGMSDDVASILAPGAPGAPATQPPGVSERSSGSETASAD